MNASKTLLGIIDCDDRLETKGIDYSITNKEITPHLCTLYS